jgi:hypothetical protein
VLRSAAHTHGVIALRYARDVVGALHLTGFEADGAASERLVITGAGSGVVVESGCRVVYRRPGDPSLDADRVPFGDQRAELCWQEPDATDGAPDSSPLASGYLGSLLHFAERLLENEAPRYGTLVDMLHTITVCERVAATKDGIWTTV